MTVHKKRRVKKDKNLPKKTRRFAIEQVYQQLYSEEQPTKEYNEEGKGITGSEEENYLRALDLIDILAQLKSELKEFDKIKEGLRTKISSIAQMVPRLNERKEVLEKDVIEKRKVVHQINIQVPKLNEQKKNVLQDISQKKKKKELLEKQIHLEQEKVKEITDRITKLTTDRIRIDMIMQQKQEEISKIDGQIKRIKSIQEYDVDLVSTLVYASKKRKW
jgi:chromosome segregation ATPase